MLKPSQQVVTAIYRPTPWEQKTGYVVGLRYSCQYIHQILIENLTENSFTDTFSGNFEFAIKPPLNTGYVAAV